MYFCHVPVGKLLYERCAGDVVREDDILLQIETDKVTIDVRYTGSEPGTVKEILVSEDDTVSVGQEVVIVETGNVSDDDSAAEKPAEKEPEAAKKPEKKAESAPKPPPTPEKKAEPAKPKPEPKSAPAAPPAQVLPSAAGMGWLECTASVFLLHTSKDALPFCHVILLVTQMFGVIRLRAVR